MKLEHKMMISQLTYRSFLIMWLILQPFTLCSFEQHVASADKVACSDELERVKIELRLRTGELTVTRGQLRAALKKMEKCGVE